VEILPAGRGVLNFLLAIYIFFSMIESVESGWDIPRYGDGNIKIGSPIFVLKLSGRDIPRYGDGNKKLYCCFNNIRLSGRDIPR
jgi:hypothetical protein